MELRPLHPVERGEEPFALERSALLQQTTIVNRQHMKRKDLVPRLVTLLALSVFALVASLFAAASIVEGTIKDANGRPIIGAEVRIEVRNGSNWNRRQKSDSNGYYIFDGLTPGVTYRVTLVVNGAVKASINNVLAKGGATQLNFDLRTGSVSRNRMVTKNGKHYVYIPAETGSHLGGRWVEVDENGNADSTGVNNVERAGSEALRRMQSNSGAVGNMTGGGR